MTRVQASADPINGKFTVTCGDYTTAPMNYGVSAATLENEFYKANEVAVEKLRVFDLARCLYRENCVTFGIYFTEASSPFDTCTIQSDLSENNGGTGD